MQQVLYFTNLSWLRMLYSVYLRLNGGEISCQKVVFLIFCSIVISATFAKQQNDVISIVCSNNIQNKVNSDVM